MLPTGASEIEVSSLRHKLRHPNPRQNTFELLTEIRGLGKDASQLLPDLISRIERDQYFTAWMAIVPLIVELSSVELFNACTRGLGVAGLGCSEKCELFRAGIVDFEEQLLEELYRIYEDSANPNRSEIVWCLEDVGTARALETLKVVDFQMEPSINERNCRAHLSVAEPGKDEEPLLGIYLQSDISFLSKVRKAVGAIADRENTKRLLLEALPGLGGSPVDSERVEAQHGLLVDEIGRLIRGIEKRLNVFVIESLKSHYGDNWWTKGVAVGTRKDCSAKREEEGKAFPAEAYFTLIDFRGIIQKSWKRFEPAMAIMSPSRGSKDDMTDWMRELNEIRNIWAHPVKEAYRPLTPEQLERVRLLHQRAIQAFQ